MKNENKKEVSPLFEMAEKHPNEPVGDWFQKAIKQAEEDAQERENILTEISLEETEEFANLPAREIFALVEAGVIGTPVSKAKLRANELGLKVVEGGKK